MEAYERYLARYRAILKFPNLMGSESAYDILRSNYEDLRRVLEDKEPYCAISIFVPSEILYALKVHFLPLEPVLATASQLGIIGDHRTVRSGIFVSDTSCCGCQALMVLYERNILPLPKYIIACSHMCDESLKAYNFVAKYYDIPIFNLDVPYGSDDRDVAYVKRQLEALIDFICEHEDTVFDIEALRSTVEISNRTNDHRQDLYSLGKGVPPVLRIVENLPTYPLFSKFGRADVENIYQKLTADVRKRVQSGSWAFKDGCYRILWLGMIPLTFPKFLGFMESLKLGFSMTELMLHSDFATIETHDPLEGIAKKIVNYPLVGRSEKRVEKIVGAINDYGIEGVVHFNHRGCIAFNGDNFIISETLKRMNVPFLVLEGDIADKEHCSEENLQKMVGEFHGVLEARYGSK